MHRRTWLRPLIWLSGAGMLAMLPLWYQSRATALNLVVSSANDSGAGSLREAIQLANAAGGGTHTITFDSSLAGQEIDLASSLPLIQSNLTINGGHAAGLVIDGQSQHRIFFVDSGNVTLANLELANGMAQGGNGAAGYTGGGGGMGAGGAIFVNENASVVVDHINFVGNQAIGGNGGDANASDYGGGGGGGAGGNGGNDSAVGLYGSTGGGGLHGDGGENINGNGGGGGLRGEGGSAYFGGGGGGGANGNGGAGQPALFVGDFGGGGGGANLGDDGGDADNANGGLGAGGGGDGADDGVAAGDGQAGGGGGGGSDQHPNGGQGGEYGGGGGSYIQDGVGGDGGRLGGGGGGATQGGAGGDFGGGGGAALDNGTGGDGGFGGGGGGAGYGGASAGVGGQGGYGAGDGGGGGSSGGDGGDGFGGAIFVREGGSLTVRNSSFTLGCACDGLGGLAGDATGTDGFNGVGFGSGLFLHDNTTTRIDGSSSSYFEDEISGPGNLVKSGTGDLVLNNVNELLGTFTIEQGRTEVNFLYYGSQIIVDPAGELGGGGAIFADVIGNGRLAPGNSIGTLTVFGNYTFGANSVYEVELDDTGASDQIQVAGIATLNGSVAVIAAPGNYTLGQQYSIVFAGFLNGSFTGVKDNLLMFDFQLAQPNAEEVYLIVVPARSHFGAAWTPNQTAVGTYLDINFLAQPGSLNLLYSTLMNSPELLPQALDQLSGELYGTTAQLQVQQTTLLLQTLMSRLRPDLLGAGAPSPIALASRRPSAHDAFEVRAQNGSACGWGGWAIGYGLGGTLQHDGNAAGGTFGVGGSLVGIERPLDSNTSVGAFAGYAGANVNGRGLLHGANIQGYQTGGYVRGDDGFNYYAAAAAVSFDRYDSQRNVSIGPVQEQLNSDYDGWQVAPYVERGFTFEYDHFAMQPYAALQYVHVDQQGFNETGGATALTVDSVEADSLRGFLGGRMQQRVSLGGGRAFTPEIRAAWLHEFLETNTAANARIGALGGTSFLVHGVDLGRDWALIGTGVNLPIATSASLFVNYDAQLNSEQVFHVGSGGVEVAY